MMAFSLDLLAQCLEMSLLALSIWLLIAQLGLVSLGHAAFYGLATYSIILLSPWVPSFWLAFALALLLCALFALITGLLVLRSRGLFFLMATLAFAQMLFVVAQDTGWVGSSDGIYASTSLPNTPWLFLALAVIGFLSTWRLVHSPFGRVLCAVHQHEDRATSLGYSVLRVQLTAYVFSALLAGLAGLVHACRFGFASPSLLSWQVSGMALLAVLLGGRRHWWSPLLGAFLLVALQELLTREDLWGSWAQHWMGALGLVMVGMALLYARRSSAGGRPPRGSPQ